MERWERIAQRIEAKAAPTQRLTKGRIAKELGMSRPALNRRLKEGKPPWTYDELETLAGLLDTTIFELISDNDEGHVA